MQPIIRLIGAVLLEQNDEWQLRHRYMQVEAMAELAAAAQLRTISGFLARPRLIAQPRQTARRKPLAPQADRVWRRHPQRS